MYKLGIVSGKFRIFHKAHKEIIIRATMEDIGKLVVIITDSPSVNRFSTVEQLKTSIELVLKDIDFDCEVLIAPLFDTILKWEQYLVNFFGHDSILLFNSKENYENITLDNKYIHCYKSLQISASTIEKNPYSEENYIQIAPEFMPYLNKKICISGDSLSGKTEIAKKIALLFDTKYSYDLYKKQSNELFNNNLSPHDFLYITSHQISHDDVINKNSNRLLIVDNDPIKMLFEFRNKFNASHHEYENIEKLLINICNSYTCQCVILFQNFKIKSNLFNSLKELYESFNIKTHVINSQSYNQKFNDTISIIEHILKKDNN